MPMTFLFFRHHILISYTFGVLPVSFQLPGMSLAFESDHQEWDELPIKFRHCWVLVEVLGRKMKHQ